MTPAIDRFDRWADGQLERLRGTPGLDQVMQAASSHGDFSKIWHAVALGRVALDRHKLTQSVALSSLLGAESLIVNQGVKRLFKRRRPTEQGDPRYEVRRPSTSSFPSGHASSAFFAATLLSGWDGRRSAPLWYGLACVVGWSRAYVRIHHPSDVIAGAALATALGLAGRSVVRRLGVR